MSKKAVSENTKCPVQHVIDIVGGKWKYCILCTLASGNPTRYSMIKRKLSGVTNMMLSKSLKELEISGMIHRNQYNEIPPRVEYTLTDKGNSFIPILLQIASWGTDDMQIDKSCVSFCDKCQSI